MSERVQGHCPACGGTSLFLGAGGYVTCSRADCHEPSAASDILADGETQHIVVLSATDFTVRHPLWERLNGELEACNLHQRLRSLDGPPRRSGTYRVFISGAVWHWEPLPATPVTEGDNR